MNAKIAYSIANKIVKRISRAPSNMPFAARDFLDLGSRAAVDQALSRLMRRGKLHRIGRGLYTVPCISRLTRNVMTADPDNVARTFARKLGMRILPSGAYAANLLGLSTQVPAKIIYLTDGRARTVRIGGHTIIFRHGSPKTMAVTGRVAPLVFQALRYLGRNGVSEKDISHLNRLLKKKDKQELRRNLINAPGWMRPVLLSIAGETPQGKPWIK
jgi:hypothetical protein